MYDNETNRFGSAAFANEEQIRKSGLFKYHDDALFVGFMGKSPLWYRQDGGLLLCAGARGGKLTTLLGYNLLTGVFRSGTLVVLDMKGELAAISQNQTADNKYCHYWNPAGLHGLNQDRCNPVDFMCHDSPSLVSDIKVFCTNIIPLSGSTNGGYFELRAREFLEAILLTLVRINKVLSLPHIYKAINLIPGGGEDWLDFAFEMCDHGDEIAMRIEQEIHQARDNPTGGFQGILGEIFKGFSCLSDPVLMQSVSPYHDGSFDFSMKDLCKSDRRYQVYFMPPAEFVGEWAPVLKSLFVAGMIYKSRAPQAPKQTWILDECAQLGKFPLITKLFTYGAGIGIRPWAVFQSQFQMDALGPNARTIISSSAALQCYHSVRDFESSSQLSQRLGAQTLSFDDEMQQARAEHAKSQAAQALLNGGDPFSTGLNYAHHKRESTRKSKQQRWLRTPDEILKMGDKMLLFVDGLEHPIEGDRRPYFDEKMTARTFFPNPYHPPLDRVRVKTNWGHKWCNVIRTDVPRKFAHFPQYRNGQYAYISG